MATQLPSCAVLVALPLTWFGCGSDPGVSVGTVPDVVASEPHRYASKSPEASRETFTALQRCADRYAPRLSSDSCASSHLVVADSGDACENAWNHKGVHSRSVAMKLGTLAAATAVRDAGIEAMDALNSLVLEIGNALPESDNRAIRLAVARSMDAILDNLVNPALREYPALGVDESTWGEIAIARVRSRLSNHTNADSSGEWLTETC